jgi:hypothetical protein
MHGVRSYRRAGRPAGPLTLRILSAGYGLLPATRRVDAYDHSFHGQPREAIRRRAQQLDVPRQLRQLLSRRYELALLLLGDDYLEACALDEAMSLGGPTLAFCGPAVARRLPMVPQLRPVPLGNSEASRFGCGLIALKGELGGRVLNAVGTEKSALARLRDAQTDLPVWLDERPRAGEVAAEAS